MLSGRYKPSPVWDGTSGRTSPAVSFAGAVVVRCMSVEVRRRRFLTWVGLLGGLTVGRLAGEGQSAVAGQSAGRLPKGFREPTLTLRALQVEHVDYPIADFRATVTVHNPNRELKLSNLTYRLTINDVECGRGRRPDALTLPKNGALDVTFPVAGDLSKVFQLGLYTLLTTDLDVGVRFRYVIDVAFEVSLLWLFTRRLQARLTGEIPLRELMVNLAPFELGRQGD